MDIYDVFGLIGITIAIGNYAYLQFKREYVKNIYYSVLNVVGTLFYLVSLIQHWNLASFIYNVTWIALSLYGIYRCLKYVKRDRDMPPLQAAE